MKFHNTKDLLEMLITLGKNHAAISFTDMKSHEGEEFYESFKCNREFREFMGGSEEDHIERDVIISFQNNDDYQAFMYRLLEATNYFSQYPFGYEVNVMVHDHMVMVQKFI